MGVLIAEGRWLAIGVQRIRDQKAVSRQALNLTDGPYRNLKGLLCASNILSEIKPSTCNA